MENEWKFDQQPNCAAITDLFILNKSKPIIRVIHYIDDDSWAFLSGKTNRTEDGRVISMQEALEIDPTIITIAHLQPGESAYRKNLKSEWKIEKE